ncbi:MAG: SPFH domain-containing protein [Victivallaceae bacterium]|nr:SPFH domain-containing protein [Victivallaceae bacterium]
MEQKKEDLGYQLPGGQYDSGIQSVTRTLRIAFVLLIVLIVGMLIYFFSLGGYFVVKPQEAVVVFRFGKYQATYDKDWHWFMPYPINSFVRIRTNPQFLKVDFRPASGVGGQENAQLEPGRDGYLLTGDANIIHCNWSLSYRVIDPKKYYETLLTPVDPLQDDDVIAAPDGKAMGRRGPQTLLTNLFQQAVITVTANRNVDEILYTKQGDYREEVERVFSKAVAGCDVGLEVSRVTLDRIYPPLKTKAAFDEVAAATSTQSTLIDQAREYSVTQSGRAQSQKAEVLAAADTYRKQIVSEVKAETIYFQSIQREFLKSPDTVLMALYNQTLSDVLTEQDGKYIIGTAGKANKQIRIKLNPEPTRPAAKNAEGK